MNEDASLNITCGEPVPDSQRKHVDDLPRVPPQQVSAEDFPGTLFDQHFISGVLFIGMPR